MTLNGSITYLRSPATKALFNRVNPVFSNVLSQPSFFDELETPRSDDIKSHMSVALLPLRSGGHNLDFSNLGGCPEKDSGIYGFGDREDTEV